MKKGFVIEQKDGAFKVYLDGDEVMGFDLALVKCDNITLANKIAELLNDAICLQGYKSELHDLNDKHQYIGTPFQWIAEGRWD